MQFEPINALALAPMVNRVFIAKIDSTLQQIHAVQNRMLPSLGNIDGEMEHDSNSAQTHS
jgi:hypothetical protein